MKVSVNGNKTQIFCFECDCFHEASSEEFGLGNGRIVGTDTIYDSIWLHIKLNSDVLVDFYLTESELQEEVPTMTKTLSECYKITKTIKY